MNKFYLVFVVLLAVALLVEEADCWGRRRRRRRRRRGSWGADSKGVYYKFNNGVRVTGSGSVSPPSVGISVSIPFGRRRRSAENEDSAEKDDTLAGTPVRTSCNKCLEVQPLAVFEGSLSEVMKKTKADFVMIVKYEGDNDTKRKLQASMTFTVDEIVHSLNDDIVPGESFTINASLSRCTCLTQLSEGMYIVYGNTDVKGNLVIAGTLIEMLRE